MTTWRQTLLYGFLTWLIPFMIGFLAFPLQKSAPEFFETIMALAVVATAVTLGVRYLRRRNDSSARKAFSVGVVWFLVCVVLDAPLFLLGGLKKLTISEYLGDIGLVYLIVPIVLWGLAKAREPRVAAVSA